MEFHEKVNLIEARAYYVWVSSVVPSVKVRECSQWRFPPGGYPHGRLLPMANGADWLEELSSPAMAIAMWILIFLGTLFAIVK